MSEAAKSRPTIVQRRALVTAMASLTDAAEASGAFCVLMTGGSHGSVSDSLSQFAERGTLFPRLEAAAAGGGLSVAVTRLDTETAQSPCNFSFSGANRSAVADPS